MIDDPSYLDQEAKKCYTDSMLVAIYKAIFRSKAGRQIFGAVSGMLIAAGVYYAVQELSWFSSSQAMLISTDNISTKAHQIRVNDKNVDDGTLRTIARHAREVASALKQEQSSAPALAKAETISSVPEVTVQSEQSKPYVATPKEVTQRDRIDFRNQQAAIARGETVEALTLPGLASSVSSAIEAQNKPVSPEPSYQVVAPKMPVTRLPNSGFNLSTVVLTALVLALCASAFRPQEA